MRKHIKKFLIVLMVITITIFSSVLSVSAETVNGDNMYNGGGYYLADVSLYLVNGSDEVKVDCSVVGKLIDYTDLFVTIRPKDQLEFLLLINQGYDLRLQFYVGGPDYFYIIFNNYLPLEFTGSSEEQVSSYVFKNGDYTGSYNPTFSFDALGNISELSFAMSPDDKFDFPAPPEPSGFLVFLSDVGVFFINCLNWFVELFSMVSVSAPLLVLVCGFVIVGFSFSLLRRTVR